MKGSETENTVCPVSSEDVLEKCMNQASEERHRKTGHTKEDTDRIITESQLGLAIALIGKYLPDWNTQFWEANVDKIS